MSGSWDAAKSLWKLMLRRQGREQTITCSYIVVAGGAGGQVPKMPKYQNRVSREITQF